MGVVLATLPLLGEAQSPLPTTDGGVEQLARNKQTMVERLLGDSPLARRVLESQDPAALALYEDARARFEEARASLAAGDATAANAAFDAAMQAMHQARKLLPSTLGSDETQVRFAALLGSVESLRRSYLDRARADVPAGKPLAPHSEERLAAVDALLEKARKEAAGARAAAGVATLQQAERLLMDALQAAIGSETVEYRRQGRSPEQVFRDELARNQSFVELVPIALARLDPSPEQVAAMNRQVEANRALRGRAEAAAAAQDLDGAIGILHQATEAIENLLREAGLSIPREPRE